MNIPNFQVITEEKYEFMLNCLPPARWVDTAFLVGEAYDSCPLTGRTRYTMCLMYHLQHVEGVRPVTNAEFQYIVDKRPTLNIVQ